MPSTLAPDPVLIRHAGPSDAGAIARLAALDSAPTPGGELIVAEVDGELRAALRVDDRTVIADPFAPTAELVVLLETWAQATSTRRVSMSIPWTR
jgi:predicted ATP-grasp superfamily ATP-dependent carboligase